MKVPVKEGNINRIVPQVNAPRERAIPEAAFVTDLSGLSNTIKQSSASVAKILNDRAAERAKEVSTKQILDQDTAFRTEMQDNLYSNEPDDKGRPRGFLSRKLDQAQGATNEFDQNYAKLKEKYLNNVGTSEQKLALSRILDSSYTGHRDTIIRYERQQGDESIQNSLESNIEIQANDAAQLSDGPSVLQAMQHAEDVQSILNKIKGYDEKTAEVENMKVRAKVAKSVFATAMEENNVAKAQSIYEGVKGKLPAETELKMKEEIESGIPYRVAVQDAFLDPIKTREKLKENLYNIKDPVKRKAAYDFTNTLAEKLIADNQETKHNTLLDSLSKGKLTLTDVENEMQTPEEQGGMKKSILVKYQKALQSGIAKDLNRMFKEQTQDKDPTPRARAVKQYSDLIDNFISENVDKWHAREKLAEAYADGIINPQEASFLNKLKTDLKDIEFNRSSSPIVNTVKAVKFWMNKNNASDEEITLNLKQLLGTLQKGEANPQEVSKSLMQNHVYSKIPIAPTLSPKGQLMMDAYGNKAMVYPDGTVEPIIAQKEKSAGAKYMESTEKK